MFSPAAAAADVPLPIVAMMPCYAETRHVHCSPEQHTINRSLLLWRCLTVALQEFLVCDPIDGTPDSFLFLGEFDTFSTPDNDAPRRVYVCPVLWLAGARNDVASCVFLRARFLLFYSLSMPACC